MGNFSLIYIFQQFFLRIYDFFYHWYAEGLRFLWRRCRQIFESMEQSFAVGITLRHFFEPLYGDYTVVGRILGPIFRVGRVLIGSFFYCIFFAICILLFVVWAGIPVFILLNIIHPIALK